MKVSSATFVASLAAFVTASPIIDTAQNVLQQTTGAQQKPGPVLIEFAPGERQWVTDAQRWELRRKGLTFFDVTDHQDFGTSLKTQAVVTYPDTMQHRDSVADLLTHIEKDNMRKHLERFTQFYTRYYRSQYGAESSAWLFDQVNATLADAGAYTHGNATVRRFEHPWGQHSIIVSIPGRTNNTVVVSAHQDSVNLLLPSLLRSPGADDDGSGTVTILEALRVVLLDEKILRNEQENTLEFFWCSAEEGTVILTAAM